MRRVVGIEFEEGVVAGSGEAKRPAEQKTGSGLAGNSHPTAGRRACGSLEDQSCADGVEKVLRRGQAGTRRTRMLPGLGARVSCNPTGDTQSVLLLLVRGACKIHSMRCTHAGHR